MTFNLEKNTLSSVIKRQPIHDYLGIFNDKTIYELSQKMQTLSAFSSFDELENALNSISFKSINDSFECRNKYPDFAFESFDSDWLRTKK
jgi:hypothetical protein